MKLYRGTQGPVNTMVANAENTVEFAQQFFAQSTNHDEPLDISHNGKRVALVLVVDGEIRHWDGYKVTAVPLPTFQGA